MLSRPRPDIRRTYSRKKCLSSSHHEDGNGKPTSTSSSSQDDEEERHFQRVVSAFKSYRSHLDEKIKLYKARITSLPDNQQILLKSYYESLFDIEKCIQHNQELVNLIIKDVQCMFVNTNHTNNLQDEQEPTAMDIDRVQVTLKQFVRDWSEEGITERTACYQPIIDEVIRNFPSDKRCVESVKVLVPGAGLGRLAYEIASMGYTCQGNEFSLFMLIASNFILNKCNGTKMFSVYPWIYQVDNNMSPEHQMQRVWFPDVNPSIMLRKLPSRFTMAAGDFLEIYQTPDEWDCIATSFFIDCAHNIVVFVEKIYEILKPGGVWINLGPLLYHFSNIPNEFSIEPPYSTLKEIIVGIGFVIEKEQTGVKTTYSQNPRSMLHYEYKSVFFVCRKPESVN